MIRTPLALVSLSLAVQAQVEQPFQAAVLQAEKDSCFVKTLDLDADGWMDAVSAFRSTASGNTHSYRIIGYGNDQTGRLVRGWSFEVPLYYSTYNLYRDQHDFWDVGDVDQDGDQDFVFSTGLAVHVVLSNGRVTAPIQSIAFPCNSATERFGQLGLGDFDLDGDLDMAVSHGVSIEIRDIDLALQTLPLRSSIPGQGFDGRIVVGELTGDATPDVFAFTKLIYPVSNGVIQAPIVFSPVIVGFIGFDARDELGDIDGDGDLDAITFYKMPTTGNPHGYRVLRRVSSTQLSEEPVVTSGGPARRLFDIDGDGDLDGVCCGGGGSYYPTENTEPSKFRVAINDGLGNFAESFDFPGLGSVAIAGVADMDHDGRMDLVAGRCVYYQRHRLDRNPMPYAGSQVQTERSIVDLDGDCDLDLEPLPWSARINRGDALNSLEPIAIPALPPGHVVTGQGHHGDWDGDGDVDFLLWSFTSNVVQGLRLLRNRGSGTFEDGGLVSGPGSSTYSPNYTDDGLAADVDADGDLDLVQRSYTTMFYGQRSQIWRNDGPGGFVLVSEFAGHSVLKVVDTDGDGLPDLIANALVSPAHFDVTLRVAKGLGNGLFSAWTAPFGSAQLKDFELADLDQDGDMDWVIQTMETTITPGQVLVHWSQGGTLTTEVLPGEFAGAPARSANVSVLDIDLDGRLDVVASPVRKARNVAAIYRRRADGAGWLPPIEQLIVSSMPNGDSYAGELRSVPADLDGDGDLDLVGARVVENLHFDGPLDGTRLQLGDGVNGSGGVRPLLGADGPFRVGESARIVLRGVRPQARVLFVSITNQPPLPITPTSLLTRPPYDPRIFRLLASGSAGGSDGSGSCEIDFVVPQNHAGITRHYTAIVLDSGAHGGRAVSNTLSITYGP